MNPKIIIKRFIINEKKNLKLRLLIAFVSKVSIDNAGINPKSMA